LSKSSKELATEHWESYLKPLLVAHGVPVKILLLIGFHYISAFVHGFKHGVESIKGEDNADK
jgi:hypothetical protein